jgi:hypothetical protein
MYRSKEMKTLIERILNLRAWMDGELDSSYTEGYKDAIDCILGMIEEEKK